MAKRETSYLAYLIRGEKGAYEPVLVLSAGDSKPEYYGLMDKGFREVGRYRLVPLRETERLPRSGVFCNAFGPSPIGRKE